MAFGKTIGRVMAAGALWSALWGPLWGNDVRFPVRHDHLRKGCDGTMTVSGDGIAFTGAKKHAWTWKYKDIQELKVAPDGIYVLTYQDRKLRLGADRAYRFDGDVPRELFQVWAAKLDQRFVTELAEKTDGWTLPAKHLRRIKGSEGTLTFGAGRIVYATDDQDDSRTWRYQDIENISSSGPFQLTVTTFERARSHYGDRKGFNFQLKQALSEARYNQLWLDIEKTNGRIQR